MSMRRTSQNQSVLVTDNDYFLKKDRNSSVIVTSPNKPLVQAEPTNLIKAENILVKGWTPIKREKWQDSSKCFICGQYFGMGVSEHHCRGCGKACCGACSGRQINKERVCDICYIQKKYTSREERREEQLKLLDNQLVTLDKDITNTANELAMRKAEFKEQKVKSAQKTNSDTATIEEIDSEFQKLKVTLKQKFTEMQNAKKVVDSQMALYKAAKDKLNDITMEVNKLDGDLQEGQMKLNKLNEDFYFLEEQLRGTREAKSFIMGKESIVSRTSHQNHGHYDDTLPKALKDTKFRDSTIEEEPTPEETPKKSGGMCC